MKATYCIYIFLPSFSKLFLFFLTLDSEKQVFRTIKVEDTRTLERSLRGEINEPPTTKLHCVALPSTYNKELKRNRRSEERILQGGEKNSGEQISKRKRKGEKKKERESRERRGSVSSLQFALL